MENSYLFKYYVPMKGNIIHNPTVRLFRFLDDFIDDDDDFDMRHTQVSRGIQIIQSL